MLVELVVSINGPAIEWLKTRNFAYNDSLDERLMSKVVELDLRC